MKANFPQVYRLEHLILVEDLRKLQEVSERRGIPFPQMVSSTFRAGLDTIGGKALPPEGRFIELFVAWLRATKGGSNPRPSAMARILTEMFLKWRPTCHKDFEDNLRLIEGEEKRVKWRYVLNRWVEFCDVHGISPALLVDGGARW